MREIYFERRRKSAWRQKVREYGGLSEGPETWYNAIVEGLANLRAPPGLPIVTPRCCLEAFGLKVLLYTQCRGRVYEGRPGDLERAKYLRALRGPFRCYSRGGRSTTTPVVPARGGGNKTKVRNKRRRTGDDREDRHHPVREKAEGDRSTRKAPPEKQEGSVDGVPGPDAARCVTTACSELV